jgi:hypothetical protein
MSSKSIHQKREQIKKENVNQFSIITNQIIFGETEKWLLGTQQDNGKCLILSLWKTEQDSCCRVSYSNSSLTT